MPPRNRGYATQPVKKGMLGRALKYMFAGYLPHMLLVVVFILVNAVATLQGTLFMQALIDDYILPMIGSGSRDFSPLAAALGRLSIFLAIGIFAAWAYNRIMVTVSQGTMERLRNELFAHMQTLPISYFDTHERGDIMSIYTNDVDTMRQLIGQTIPQVINSMVTVVVTLVNMFRLSLPLTLVSLAMVALQVFISGKLGGLSRNYFIQRQKDLGRENAYVEEMLEGQKVVKVFCHEEAAIAEFDELNEALRVSADKADGIANILMPLNGNLANVSYVLMAILGAAVSITGTLRLSLGTLVSFLTLSRNFTRPITQISMQINAVVMAMAGADRIFTLMDEAPEQDEGYVELVNAVENPDGTLSESAQPTGVWAWKHPHQADGTVTYTRLTGEIVMEDVDFSYDGVKTVLHDVTLYGLPGQKIAFVGSTGAGKTTITNLINRFYDIADGKIRYDGINIQKIKKPALRASLGMVLQDTQLFTGTIMDNIRYGRLNATDEECIAAAKLANADSFIRRLPDGYDTFISGNGSSLSQGERQMLSIARAAVANPPAMVLDEATSSIDTRTELLVQKAMDALMHGRTTFVIAHRLSTVRNSDCIMVLEQGRIIERGTHDELIEKKGRYYQLYTGNQAS